MPQNKKLSLRAQCRRRGFSMVELLVAVAIVGILSSLAVGAFGKVRDQARTAVTISNLKQLQAANSAFASDNDGFFVKAFDGGSWGDGWKGNQNFLSYLERSGRNGWTDPSKVVRSGFPQVNSLIAYSIPKSTVNGAPIQYWESGPLRLRAIQLERPASTIAFIDANDWWVNPGGWNSWSSIARNDGTNRNGDALVAYRNNGKAAAVTFAGNVVLLQRSELNPSTPEGAWRWYYNGRQWN